MLPVYESLSNVSLDATITISADIYWALSQADIKSIGFGSALM